MNFSAQRDVDVPIEHLFGMICDFERFERIAKRYGATVQRLDALPAAGIGVRWDVRFEVRGKERDMIFEVVEFDAPDTLGIAVRSSTLMGNVAVQLRALSNDQTRLTLALDLKPQTLTARLFVKSLMLTKPALDRKFEDYVAEQAREMEAQYRRTA